MTQKESIKALQFVKNVRCDRWATVMKIVDEIKNNKVVVLEKKWRDPFDEKYKVLDLSQLSTWSTYDYKFPYYLSCIDLNFYIKDNKLFCDAKIYDGDILDGERRDLRFSTTLELKNSFVIHIKETIIHEFNNAAKYKYQSYLEDLEKLWIESFTSSILKK